MRRSRAQLLAMITSIGLLPLQACSLFSGDEQAEVQEQVEQDEAFAEADDQEGDFESIEQEETVEADVVADTPLSDDSLNGNPLLNTTEPSADLGMDDDLGMADMGTNIVTDPDPTAGANALAPDMGTDPLADMADPMAADPMGNSLMTDPSALNAVPPLATNDALMEAAAPSNAAAAAPMAMAAPAPGNARVYFVVSNTDLVDGPNGNNVTASLVQGDPVLASIEGEWANVLNRGWLPIASLSETPVGRSKIAQNWVQP